MAILTPGTVAGGGTLIMDRDKKKGGRLGGSGG